MNDPTVQATKRCSKCGEAAELRCGRCRGCRPPKNAPLADRFWAKVTVGTPQQCWIWLGTGTRGYGKIHDKATGKMIRATLVSWEIANGPAPSGAHVLHRCDNPSCVNPAHLFLGTNADNIADKLRKGRQRNGAHVYRGERHHGTRLTAAQVLEIRAAAGSGRTMKAIGADYGITRESVGAIMRGVRWRHLSAPGDGGSEPVG